MTRMKFRQLGLTTALAVVSSTRLWGGGSGLNVAVVVNQASSHSVALGNYHVEQRDVPAEQVIRIDWPGSVVQWSLAEFTNTLLNPLHATLTARGLTHQIEYVLLSMDIPYRVVETNAAKSGVNSTTAALYYGFKPDTTPPSGAPASCSLPDASSNSYAFSEFPFGLEQPNTATTQSFLTFMLTQSNLAEAKRVVDQGVTSDGTLPPNQVLLGKSTDYNRNGRYTAFDNAIFETRVAGRPIVVRTNLDSPFGKSGLLGYQNGHYSFSASPNTFVPGAMADNLTSFGGYLFDPTDQRTLLGFLGAGATASHGTVVEPCAYLEKFPSPLSYFYQGRGFNIAESYYLSLAHPFQGLLVGEPLAAPFAVPGSGVWSGLSDGALLTGSTNLSLTVLAPDAARPVQQVDLFLDAKRLQTVTNIAPRQNNQLQVTINGTTATYTVSAGATLASVASGLASALNANPIKNNTRVEAATRGDRIELRSTLFGRAGSGVSLATTNLKGSASALTVGVRAARATFLDTEAQGVRQFRVTHQNPPVPTHQLSLTLTKTNGTVVTVTVTNSSSLGVFGFVQQLANAVNTHPALTNADGVMIDEVKDLGVAANFDVRARSPGWGAARITAALTASAPQVVDPGGTQTLEEYLDDLQPRNHLYLSAGFTNLPVSFSFNTSTQANGFHELRAVGYEGTHVRTQTHVPVQVIVSNTPLWAEFSTLLGGDPMAIEGTLAFRVVANTNPIAKVELFSTGGLLDTATVNPAVVSVPASSLGPGRHPFHALVTTTSGQRFRTETLWYRVIEAEPPVALTITAQPAHLTWPATAGRPYTVKSSSDVGGPYTFRGTVVPTNNVGSWAETNAGPLRFYRLETTW